MYDLIIVGSGPAGMSAALLARKANINFLLITAVENISVDFITHALELKKYRYPPVNYDFAFSFLHEFNRHRKAKSIPLKLERVLSIEKSNGGFLVSTDVDTHLTNAVIVATGRRYKKLDSSLAGKYEGNGLSYCVFCDGSRFENKTVAIIGGGKGGFLSTLYMLNIAKKIYLIERMADLQENGMPSFTMRLLEHSPKLEALHGTELTAIDGSPTISSITVSQGKNKRTLNVDGVFVKIGYEPNTEIINNPVRKTKKNELVVDANNMTSIPGIFAAGDVTNTNNKTVNVALIEGERALDAVIEYLKRRN